MKGEALSSSRFHIALIVVSALLVYSNTLDVPFQWDENLYIKENPFVKDPGSFVGPSDLKGTGLYSAVERRTIGYLTFALNYRLGGLDVRGYHAFNIAVHALNGVLVYLLVRCAFMAPFLGRSSLRARSGYIALFTGLLFVSHPVQTEAVTYIFQRFVSLVTAFYLFSLLMYILWRLEVERRGFVDLRPLAFYVLSFTSAFLAMKTKENAFTLPIAVLLFELLFFKGTAGRRDPLMFFVGITGIRFPLQGRLVRLLRLYPMLLSLLVIPLTITGLERPPWEVSSHQSASMMGLDGTSKPEYFFTQYRVLMTYIRLVFFPVGQNISHDYPVYGSIADAPVAASFLAFSILLSGSVYLLYRSRRGEASLRLAAFGLIWFLLALAVESTLVPLPMVMNEYRLYLPSAGVFAAIVGAVFFFADRLGARRPGATKAALAALALVVVVFQAYTVARNGVWRSGVTLWEDVVRKSPGDPRGHNNLAMAYREAGRIDGAVEQFEAALALQPDNAALHKNLASAYGAAGDTERAIGHYLKAVGLRPGMASAHIELGIVLCNAGRADEAIGHFQSALDLDPASADAHNNLAVAHLFAGHSQEAKGHLQRALDLDPGHVEAHFNLGYVYLREGLTDPAHIELDYVLEKKPDHVQARMLHDEIHKERH